MDKLTQKQKAFAEQFLVDLNATAAAIRAGYSARTAKHIGSELLATPKVAAAINAAKSARSAQVSVDAAWVLVRLVAEADADVLDLYGENGYLRPVAEWPLIWRQGLISGIEVQELFEGEGQSRKHVGRVTKVRFSDRIRRLEMIGKHVNVQAFKEHVAISGLENLGERLERAKKRNADADASHGVPRSPAGGQFGRKGPCPILGQRDGTIVL